MAVINIVKKKFVSPRTFLSGLFHIVKSVISQGCGTRGQFTAGTLHHKLIFQKIDIQCN